MTSYLDTAQRLEQLPSRTSVYQSHSNSILPAHGDGNSDSRIHTRYTAGKLSHAHFQREQTIFKYNSRPDHSLHFQVYCPKLFNRLDTTRIMSQVLQILYAFSFILPILSLSIPLPMTFDSFLSVNGTPPQLVPISTANLTVPTGTWHCNSGSFSFSHRVHFGDCRTAISKLPGDGPSIPQKTSHE